MICCSIKNKTKEEIFGILDKVEMAEIRLDLCRLSPEDIEEIFACSDVPLVATCRVGEGCPAAEAESRLLTAVRAGAAYVDIELEAPAMMSKRLRREARECGTAIIRSFHDFTGTDSRAALEAIADKCRHLGADVVKIVTTASSEQDAERLLSLYSTRHDDVDLIAFCMGERGRKSRLDCLALGAAFTYAALSQDEVTAPGQWTYDEMFKAVYGDRVPVFTGPLDMPCSKSFAQRAVIAAALAEGTSVLTGYSPCGDNEAALSAAAALGAEIKVDGGTLTVKGNAGADIQAAAVHCGESGFLTRLLIPLLAAKGPGSFRLTGEGTLPGRQLRGAARMMEIFGVNMDSEHVPVTCSGRFTVPSGAEVSGKEGSQLISGLLYALPLAGGGCKLTVAAPKSIPYIFITVDVLKHFGVKLKSEMEGGEDFAQSGDWSLCDSIRFEIPGGQTLKAAALALEADWSAAANFLVAGAVFGEVAIAGLDTRSLQADLSILDILTDAGAIISQEDESGIIHVHKAPLRAFEVDASNCPDLFPIISVLAAFCQGRSSISGLDRLASKESDRAAAILQMLSGLGVRASVKGNKLLVDGLSLARRHLSGRLLEGGDFSSHKDHRMVMALKVAALGASSPVMIDDEDCVAKSFPEFNEIFSKL